MSAAYLDHNATTPLRPEVVAATAACLGEVGNPSSVHGFGRVARRRVEQARAQVAALVGACAEDVVFTSGGTEANALALTGSGATRVLVSAIEHDSVLQAVPGAERLPVDGDGLVISDALEEALARDGRSSIVSIMLANNETGVVQPVAALAERAKAHGALVHCDASQAAGKIPVSIAELGVDLLTLSAHKLGGPQGVGALVVTNGDLVPQLRGGGQERGRRAGTENVPGIVGFGLACTLCGEGLGWLAEWRDMLERRVAEAAACRILGASAPRLPNTSCIGLSGMASEVQVMVLDLAGVAVSAGSACSSGKVRTSHVLEAMGVPGDVNAIRVSLGWNSTLDEVERFLAAWTTMAARAAGKQAASVA